MPYAPPTRCLVNGCAAFAVARGRCDEHYKPWAQPSRRNTELTSKERHTFRARVLARDTICRACGTAPATQADHITPVALGGARTDLTNGQGLCAPCHDAKTRAEAAARNQARRRRP